MSTVYPTSPIIKKFFVNKIESSLAEWGDYLLEIADIFSTFDGEPFDRNFITERFSAISGRTGNCSLRDPSNFRDEFGAYGPYLGLFHFEHIDGQQTLFLSKAAKHFLCSSEPDVESFCRTQLSLFQYPNGAGAVHSASNVHVQHNVKHDTLREISNNIRLNPFRLLCRIVVALHEVDGVELADIVLPYSSIFMLFNNPSVNCEYSPRPEVLLSAFKTTLLHMQLHTWAFSGRSFVNFKRNFHIFERTGVFERGNSGLKIITRNIEKVYSYISVIANMDTDFLAFEPCYLSQNIDDDIKRVITSSCWGKYYDAFNLPVHILSCLSDEITENDIVLASPAIGAVGATLIASQFPEFTDFDSQKIRSFVPSLNVSDPYETLILREKANREHARILNMLAARLRLQGYDPKENIFVDMYVNANNHKYLFEVKSNNSKNTLSQIRKAISQLYEYRYRSQCSTAQLCIVLQQKPDIDWIVDYVTQDRKIALAWLVDECRIETAPENYSALQSLGILT